MENFLGVGFVFRPTDKDMVRSYLLKKVTGEPLPCDTAVGICDLYGTTEPWEIWERFGRPGMVSNEECLYFFTKLKKVKKGCEGPRICRSIGQSAGTRHQETVEKMLIVEGVRCGIRSFRYENKILEAQHGCWLMKEYCLCDFKDSYVLCRLKKNTMKRRKAEENLQYHLQGHAGFAFRPHRSQTANVSGSKMTGTDSQGFCQDVSTSTLFDRNHIHESGLIPIGTGQNLSQNEPDNHQMRSSYHLQDQSVPAFHHHRPPTISVFDNHMIGSATGSQDLCQHVFATTLFAQNHMCENELIPVQTGQNLHQNAPDGHHTIENGSQDLFQVGSTTTLFGQNHMYELIQFGTGQNLPQLDHQMIGSATGSQDLYQHVPTTTLSDQNNIYQSELIRLGFGQNLQQNELSTVNSMQIMPPLVGGANSFGTDLFQFEGTTREYAELEGGMRMVADDHHMRAAIGDFGDHSDLHNQVNGGDSIQMAACYLRRGDSDQWRKKKRKYAELEGDTNNEMTTDLTRASVDMPYLEQPQVSGEHHMRSVEYNGRNSSIYNEFFNFQNKISSMTDDELFGSKQDLVYIEP